VAKARGPFVTLTPEWSATRKLAPNGVSELLTVHNGFRACLHRITSQEIPGNLNRLAAAMPRPAESAMEAKIHRPAWKTLLAFAIIYFVWGSTFLAIRVGVREVPPFLLAAMRFLIAGVVLYGWTIAHGECSPSRRQWASASLLAILIFVFDYGLVFWAEQRVPSGIAAVMLAAIPAFMVRSEIIFLRTQRLTVRLALALLIGIGGVAALVSRSLNLGGAPIDRVGALALIVASISWSVASALARKLALPPSKVMSSRAQMLAGGVFLALAAAALGEFRNLRSAKQNFLGSSRALKHPAVVTLLATILLLCQGCARTPKLTPGKFPEELVRVQAKDGISNGGVVYAPSKNAPSPPPSFGFMDGGQTFILQHM
jgi:drug/metabolite transporter (DMT)-like permease